MSRAIADHLRRARAGLLGNPAYVPLGVRQLYIGEYVGEGDALWPGEVLGYLAQLERGGASEGAHACWHDPSGADTCTEHTLDGLLDGATMRPRAPWWAMRWYARGTDSRVGSRSADPALAVMAARRPGGSDWRHAEIVLGYLDTHDRPLPPRTDVLLDVRGLAHLRFMRGAARSALDRLPRAQSRSGSGHAGRRPAARGGARQARRTGSARSRPAPPRRAVASPLRADSPSRRAGNGVDLAGGALRQLDGQAGCFVDPMSGAPSQGCAVARGMAATHRAVLSPDGRDLYAPSSMDWGVVAFRRDARTGRLRQRRGAAGCLSSRPTPGCTRARGMVWAFWAAMSPDGRQRLCQRRDRQQRRGAATRSGDRRARPARGHGGVRAQQPVAGQRRAGRRWGRGQLPVGRRPALSAHDRGVARRSLPLRGRLRRRRGARVRARAGVQGALLARRRKACVASATGAEGTCTPARALDGVTDLALSRDGRFLYATAYHDGAVSTFARDPASGRLEPVATPGGRASPTHRRAGLRAGPRAAGARSTSPSAPTAAASTSSRATARRSPSSTSTPLTGALHQKAGAAGLPVDQARARLRGPTRGLRGARGVNGLPGRGQRLHRRLHRLGARRLRARGRRASDATARAAWLRGDRTRARSLRPRPRHAAGVGRDDLGRRAVRLRRRRRRPQQRARRVRSRRGARPSSGAHWQRSPCLRSFSAPPAGAAGPWTAPAPVPGSNGVGFPYDVA